MTLITLGGAGNGRRHAEPATIRDTFRRFDLSRVANLPTCSGRGRPFGIDIRAHCRRFDARIDICADNCIRSSVATAHKNNNTLHGLHRRLTRLVGEARRNEHRLKRFQALELRLMACASLPELLRLLLYRTRASFGWDFTTLLLLDPKCEVRRLLERVCDPDRDLPDVIFTATEAELETQLGGAKHPVLGSFDPQSHEATFRQLDRQPSSIALLPLIHDNRLIGSLNLGSRHDGRFERHCATDFLQHLAAVVSVCLETSIIRERLKHLGLTDPLTGVSNRRSFEQHINEAITEAIDTRSAVSCLFIDVDRFKRINDVHGHQAGDEVLRQVACLIREQLRRSDVVARYGGEEFAALLSHADLENALEVAQRIRLKVERHRFISAGTELRVSVSVGVSTYTPREAPPSVAQIRQKLIEQADAALYRAKREGRNRIASE